MIPSAWTSFLEGGILVDKFASRIDELRSIRGEYAKLLLLSDQLSQEEKDKQLSTLMTEMERKYHIPALRNETFNQENPDVMRIYLELSQARATL
jgi:hypothetical protein